MLVESAFCASDEDPLMNAISVEYKKPYRGQLRRDKYISSRGKHLKIMCISYQKARSKCQATVPSFIVTIC